jgi:hypothetical protein
VGIYGCQRDRTHLLAGSVSPCENICVEFKSQIVFFLFTDAVDLRLKFDGYVSWSQYEYAKVVLIPYDYNNSQKCTYQHEGATSTSHEDVVIRLSGRGNWTNDPKEALQGISKELMPSGLKPIVHRWIFVCILRDITLMYAKELNIAVLKFLATKR